MAKKFKLLKDEAVVALGHLLGRELKPINEHFETTRDVFYAFNLHYTDVALSISVKNNEGEDIATPTIVLKTGAIIGSGDLVGARSDGKYVVRKGSYNYSVIKTGYETESGIILVDYHDAIAEEKKLQITFKKLSVVTVLVVDKEAEEILNPVVVIKTGAVKGEGDEVTAEEDATYKLGTGDYNYIASKTGYETGAGTFEIVEANLDGAKTITVVLKAPCVVTLTAIDKDDDAIDAPTILLKKGAVIGEGDELTAEDNGSYKFGIGDYNYIASKTGYETKAGTFTILVEDLDEAKTLSIVLKALCILTVAITDEDKNPIDSPIVVIKTGAVVGAGDVVNAELDGTYKAGVGTYNYLVSKETYVTRTGTFEVITSDLDNTKTLELILVLDAQ